MLCQFLSAISLCILSTRFPPRSQYFLVAKTVAREIWEPKRLEKLKAVGENLQMPALTQMSHAEEHSSPHRPSALLLFKIMVIFQIMMIIIMTNKGSY